jgi:hypothetical protein
MEEEKDYGIPGIRGTIPCGSFHEYPIGPDKFCNCCRPSPERAKPAEDWWVSSGRGEKAPVRATPEWRDMFEAWVSAGRPGALPKKTMI